MFKEFRLKIIDRTYANHTGQLGPIKFVNGTAVNKVRRPSAIAFNSGLRSIIVDDNGKTIQEFKNGMLALTGDEMRVRRQPNMKRESDLDVAADAPVNNAEPGKSVKAYTREYLEQVADKSGLKGLREIAEKMNVRGKSIPQLIVRILEK